MIGDLFDSPWKILIVAVVLIVGGACAALIEVAELIVWSHDRRRARLHPDPFAGLADDDLSPLG